jgi:hypothetical protein
MRHKFFFVIFLLSISLKGFASYILIPMDAKSQDNHLKSYGIAYWVLNHPSIAKIMKKARQFRFPKGCRGSNLY